MLKSLGLFQQELLRWYRRNHRQLPWRSLPGTHPDPYHVLVSEAMLQQTQVATVIPYFLRFIERFPTLAHLAGADPQQILRLWQGLGYYSRATNLHKAAQKVLADFGGQIPQTVPELLTLPGVGRYTAGAVASLAFGRREPILDGNVIRVLCRLDMIEGNTTLASTKSKLWRRAEDILPDAEVGDFNSALMELGATVCVPRNPSCQICPVRGHCEANALEIREERLGTAAVPRIQDRLPMRTAKKERPVERRWVFCILHAGKVLIEQRPAKGRWAGMWQFVTLLAEGKVMASVVTTATGLRTGPLRPLGRLTHNLTHRRYEFGVYRCEVKGRVAAASPRRWVPPGELSKYPLSRPQLEVATMLAENRA